MDIAALLKDVPDYTRVYHESVIPQHLQYYFLNRQHDLMASIKKDGNAYGGLNAASSTLAAFLQNKLDSISPGAGTDSTFVNEVNQYIADWQGTFDSGKVYASLQYAERICELFEQQGHPIKEEIRQHGEIEARFIQISYWVKAAFQVEIWVEESNLSQFIANSVSFLAEKPHLAYYIKEMTIRAKPQQQLINGIAIPYNNVKIRLMPEVVNTYRNPLVMEICEAALEWNKDFSCNDIAQRPFTVKAGNNVSISQGNFNYKQFLQLLGALEKVYDSNYDHAYLLNQ
ncbi:hypothetical protein [Chitinophaga rhizophila]|uniref:Uncharacterized protein n=1 Tax=Chitinophaga rhizophila TaxID=2866212 RepID=A0ABS7GH71_9BACT|nr:hypothetical protein [Chitinophaga rhizophila]MBW8685997.1 hypothetical protein [Chitinophaga rhizophila]